MKRVTLGLIQMCVEGSPKTNLDRVIRNIRETQRKGAQIVSLPELFQFRYFPQNQDPKYFDLAEPIPGPTSQLFCALAKELEIVLIVPLFEKCANKTYYNTALVIDTDGTIQGTYRKMHIPNDSCFWEKFYFTPGDLGFQSFKTTHGNIGVMICWDQWFPEAARHAALAGAHILFYPTAIGWQTDGSPQLRQKERNAWRVIQQSHAIANGVFVAAVNRVGKEDKLLFWGSSFVSDPFGEIIAEASETKEQILITSCDLSQIEAVRKDWPFLKLRRPDTYDLSQ